MRFATYTKTTLYLSGMNRRLQIVLILLGCLLASASISAQEITKKNGRYKIHYASGKVKAKGKVRNYHKIGEWKFLDEEGRVTVVVNYDMDTMEGYYAEYFPDGKVSIAGSYCQSRKCGNWKTYDQEGQLISDENFTAGIQNGTQRFWFPNGQMRDSICFDNGVILFRKAWYRGGRVKTVEHYQDGLPEGKWIVYKDPEVATDTFPESSDEYHLGKKHGWHYWWNKTSLIEAYHYTNGLPDGTFTRYAFDGKPVMVMTYSMGKLNGATTYFKDGLKLKDENYQEDLRDGVQIEYGRDQRVLKREWYHLGILDSSKSYFPNGKVAIRRSYVQGAERSDYTEYDSSGVLIMSGHMHGEKRDGEWTTYYPTGKIRSTTNYVDGQIIGLFTKYYPNGRKMIQYTFLPVGTNTMPDVWNDKGKLLKMGSPEYNEIVEGNRPGEIVNDPGEFNRSIIDHRIMENTIGDEMEVVPDVIGDMGYEDQVGMVEENDTGAIFTYCEIMPEFPGGDSARVKFVQQNTVYTGDAHDKTGTVYVQYVVETDGSVNYVTVAKGVSGASELDAEAVRIVRLFPKQVPARMNGRPVRCTVIVPIRFSAR